jgi:hypothetical protein
MNGIAAKSTIKMGRELKMSITIDNTNRISIDGRETGLAISQRCVGTVVYTVATATTKYAEHIMPHVRYSTAHDKPASGAAGRTQLEADIRALLETLK